MAGAERMTIEEVVRKVLRDEHADVIRESVRLLAQELMEAEVAALIGAQRGERCPEDPRRIAAAIARGSGTRAREQRSAQVHSRPVLVAKRLGIPRAGLVPDHLDVEPIGVVEVHDPRRPRVTRGSGGRAFGFEATADLSERLLGGRQQSEMVEAAALEHRPGCRRQCRPVEDLERVKNGRGAHLQEDVPKTLLGQIERLLRLKHSFVEPREAVEVVAQEGEMLDAFNKPHRAHLPVALRHPCIHLPRHGQGRDHRRRPRPTTAHGPVSASLRL